MENLEAFFINKLYLEIFKIPEVFVNSLQIFIFHTVSYQANNVGPSEFISLTLQTSFHCVAFSS